ncbi:MAG: bifunctional homocysteine S-methyltransferase/methylenetetrahydrofolate reductase [Acidobacteriota bacterium]
MMRPNFRDFLEENVIVFDGAMGTQLYAKGIYINKCFDELNVSAPDLVREVHREYIKVGVDVIETNTFGANRVKLGKHGLEKYVTRINYEGVQIARKEGGEEIFVAGSIGPLGIRIEPWGPTSFDEAREFFREQAEGLLQGGVDLFVIETFYDLEELHQAILAVKDLCDLPIIAQMTLEDDGNSLEGVPPEEFTMVIDGWGVDAVGVNCSVGPQVMLQAIEKMCKVTATKLSAQPNAGKPRNVEGRNIYLCSPEYMAEYAKRFILNGVKVVGGCCGTTPQHIAAIRRAVKAVQPTRRKTVAIPAAIEKKMDVEVIAKEKKSELARKITEKIFVKAVEIVPPRGCDTRKAVEGAVYLKESGVDAINIPDGPRASARMSPLSVAYIIEGEVGIETILHYCCRDRNLLGMQSDLLGAYSMGIRNLLIITGDPPKLGTYPDATAVFDVDSIGLTNMVYRLNHGLDLGGNPIGKPTGFHIGVGVNPGAIDLKKEISRLEWKVGAGAEFAITQPVFDVEMLKSFLHMISHVRIPILAGIWPLTSLRNAEFMNNEVPGTQVPHEIMERMRKAGSSEAARREGIAIAQECLLAIRNIVEGVQVSTPAERYETAVEVLSALK